MLKKRRISMYSKSVNTIFFISLRTVVYIFKENYIPIHIQAYPICYMTNSLI